MQRLVDSYLELFLDRQMPEFVLQDEVKEPAYERILSPEYWAKTYSDPHALKVPYAALDLLKRLPEKERARAERSVCKLLTLMGKSSCRLELLILL